MTPSLTEQQVQADGGDDESEADVDEQQEEGMDEAVEEQNRSEWVSSFLTAHQHIIGHSVP